MRILSTWEHRTGYIMYIVLFLYEIKSHYVELLAILQVVTLAHFSTNDIYREYAFNLIAGTQSTKQKRIVKNT